MSETKRAYGVERANLIRVDSLDGVVSGGEFDFAALVDLIILTNTV